MKEKLTAALDELGYVLERKDDPRDVRTWPADEAAAYQKFGWQPGIEAANTVRIHKLSVLLEDLLLK